MLMCALYSIDAHEYIMDLYIMDRCSYVQEYRIDWCSSAYLLPLDFTERVTKVTAVVKFYLLFSYLRSPFLPISLTFCLSVCFSVHPFFCLFCSSYTSSPLRVLQLTLSLSVYLSVWFIRCWSLYLSLFHLCVVVVCWSVFSASVPVLYSACNYSCPAHRFKRGERGRGSRRDRGNGQRGTEREGTKTAFVHVTYLIFLLNLKFLWNSSAVLLPISVPPSPPSLPQPSSLRAVPSRFARWPGWPLTYGQERRRRRRLFTCVTHRWTARILENDDDDDDSCCEQRRRLMNWSEELLLLLLLLLLPLPPPPPPVLLDQQTREKRVVVTKRSFFLSNRMFA